MSVSIVTTISSDDLLDDIEQNFRIAAGPGAGKTHWLINHLKNVLHKSNRLSKARKIACITYTNTGVETILKRLGTTSERVDVSTIHSFLYRHLVKPYASFVAGDYNLNLSEVDGHDDIVLSNYSFLNDWKTKTGQLYLTDDLKIVQAIKSVRWKFRNEGDLVPLPKFAQSIDGYNVKTDSYLFYKRMAWEKGVLHHDDVLFFSYQIIKKCPFVLEIMRSKFPYFFIDEFQDSNPIQVKIIQLIVQRETILGIIGDKAQSIYRFLGADPSQFSSFTIPRLIEYVMPDNRRSSNEIVALLNSIRKDITQHPRRNISISRPAILVGKMNSALVKAKTIATSGPVCSLSRDNITSNALKKEIDGVSLNARLFDDLIEADKPGSGNGYRSRVVIACIKAVEYAKQGKFKEAIKELGRELKGMDKLETKKAALKNLSILLEKYDEYKDKTLYDFCLFIKAYIKPGIAGLRTGVAKTFYSGRTYQELSLCVNVPEEISQNRTIHKSKGDEFDNVLLVLNEEKDLAFILSPDLQADSDAGEEQRINYVAISRAKNRLFISVPTLSEATQLLLQTHFDIEAV